MKLRPCDADRMPIVCGRPMYYCVAPGPVWNKHALWCGVKVARPRRMAPKSWSFWIYDPEGNYLGMCRNTDMTKNPVKARKMLLDRNKKS